MKRLLPILLLVFSVGVGAETLEYTLSSGAKYVGGGKNGNEHGQGTYTWPNGNRYVGEWVADHRLGHGTYTWFDGAKYVGEWKREKRDGHGIYTWAHEAKYVGEWRGGNPWKGKVYDKHGNVTAIYSIGNLTVGIHDFFN